MNKKVVLVILDGWGHGAHDKTDGVFLANTPFVDSLYQKYPNAELVTYGEQVGLPEGQMGNSEVGHLNIGAGRIVYQDLLKIDIAVRDNSIAQNVELLNAIHYAKENGKKLHFIGLISKGGVHSSQAHLYKLCDIAKEQGLKEVFIHAFTDGRDTSPNSGIKYMEELENHLKNSVGKVASVIGRYYAMDRDTRWERIKTAYDLLVEGKGTPCNSSLEAIQNSYNENISDEFIKPCVITNSTGEPIATIDQGDAVVCFNFRTDRCREITIALTQKNMPEYGMKTVPLYYVTMTNYDASFKEVKVMFDKDNLKMTLGEVLSKAGKKQIRIAETEKYPHVTYFFSGGRETPFEGETRILINSPKVPTYDLQPEMSAPEVTSAICEELKKGEVDFVCINFANPDMVGHTGIPEAIIKACETVDTCLKKVVDAGLKNNYAFIVIADHGNADIMMNEHGEPHTAHTTNPVPLIVINGGVEKINTGILADVAPTILHLMGIHQPEEMTGHTLLG
ncbi:MAG: 2,3-bisphosphoglycerate-independent phosphoglycerate mutase [Flavobacteriales bacterium]